MPIIKLNLDESQKAFDSARNFANAARKDSTDPASANLVRAMHDYFTANGAALTQLVFGMNNLLERLDRIEARLDHEIFVRKPSNVMNGRDLKR